MVGRITKSILKSSSVVVQGNFLKKVKFSKEGEILKGKKRFNVDALERC